MFDGDGTVKVFVLAHHPIHENSQQVLVGGALQTETTHYTMDDDLGELEFTTAPASGSDNVKATYRYCNWNDTEWIMAINNALELYGEKFWTEILDNTTFDSIKDQYEYNLGSLANGAYVFKVLEAHYRTSSSGDWIPISSHSNLKYFKDRNRIWLNPPFATADYDIQLRVIRRPVPSTTTTDTVDVEDDEIPALKEYAKYKYFMHLSSIKAGDISALSKDTSVSPARDLIALARLHRDEADRIAGRVKKSIPVTHIPHVLYGTVS